MNAPITIDREKFHKEGFLHIKNVFSQNEMQSLREIIEKLKYEDEPKGNIRKAFNDRVIYFIGDLLGKKGLEYLVFDPRIVGIARQLLGEKIVYFGESSIQIGAVKRGFHRDNADRQTPDTQEWNGPCAIIKFGIYMQDHKNYSGGLKVRLGSHNKEDFLGPNEDNEQYGKGKMYNIPSEAGDLMVWSLRLAHSANFVRLKWLPGHTFHPNLENTLESKLPFLLKSKGTISRIAAWIAYGQYENPNTDYYIKYYVGRGDFVDHWEKSRYDDEILKKAVENNIEIRRPISQYGTKWKN